MAGGWPPSALREPEAEPATSPPPTLRQPGRPLAPRPPPRAPRNPSAAVSPNARARRASKPMAFSALATVRRASAILYVSVPPSSSSSVSARSASGSARLGFASSRSSLARDTSIAATFGGVSFTASTIDAASSRMRPAPSRSPARRSASARSVSMPTPSAFSRPLVRDSISRARFKWSNQASFRSPPSARAPNSICASRERARRRVGVHRRTRRWAVSRIASARAASGSAFV